MSSGIQDLVVAEKHATSEEGDSASDLPPANGVARDYELKCALINKCMQEEIGFGRYQWQLFVLSGLGWLADNLWLQGLAVVLPAVEQELNPSRVEYAVLAEFAGMIVGATTWGVLADIIGRKVSFNATLFIGGIFGIAAGGGLNFVSFSSLIACMGFGVGGNLPVDGALYLEFIPASHQWTLTLLSVWWAFGQLVASLISWVFIANYSCNPSIPFGECPRAQNMGWRYTLFTLGAVTFVIFIMRYFVFDLQESPKYLVAQGRDEEAVAVLEHVARRNGRTISLKVEDLHRISESSKAPPASWRDSLRRSFTDVSFSHIKPLFSTRRLALNTTLIILIWGLIGIAYPLYSSYLPLYLEARGSPSGATSLDVTYRNYAIVSILGVPGSLIACYVVDLSRGTGKFTVGGRKMSLAVFTLLSSIFMFLFTTSKTQMSVLGYSCANSLVLNAMYGVLYAYTPESFPAPHRGTGDALCSALNRIGGFIAPLIKIATTPKTGTVSANAANGPVFVSAALFMVSAFVTLLLPIETAGRGAL
ncbi:MFS general substrate transporter [Boletus edulis BED1]|uniref:MFS general substrate transporter n=1 Tax=Boletus edulis BED1 TaxID=1328754 RepID=A0AAD4BX53_BOLED|nr:MFS general substrate transporter [Boletus edulis BED1]